MRRRVLVLLSVVVAAACWSGVARAGYLISPQGVTTARPTFTVFLEPQEQSLAEVYVASDTQMGTYYIPVQSGR